jgi:hypothetical protein
MVVDGRRGDGARLVEGNVRPQVQAVLWRSEGVYGDHARDVAAEVRRVGPRIEVHGLQQLGRDDRRPQRQVKGGGHADAVYVEAGVAGVRPAHDEDGSRPDRLRDAGQRGEHPDGIPPGAGGLRRLLGVDRDAGHLLVLGANLRLVSLTLGLGIEPDDDLVVAAGPDVDGIAARGVARELRFHLVRAGRQRDRQAPLGVRLSHRHGTHRDRGTGEGPSRPALEHQDAQRNRERRARDRAGASRSGGWREHHPVPPTCPTSRSTHARGLSPG